jgi:hypothetical protein
MNRLRLRARCSAQKTGAKERPARMVRNFLKDTSGIKVTGLFAKVDNARN